MFGLFRKKTALTLEISRLQDLIDTKDDQIEMLKESNASLGKDKAFLITDLLVAQDRINDLVTALSINTKKPKKSPKKSRS